MNPFSNFHVFLKNVQNFQITVSNFIFLDFQEYSAIHIYFEVKKSKYVLNLKLQYVLKYSRWQHVFWLLATRGRVFWVMGLIIQHVVFWIFTHALQTQSHFRACQWVGPDVNCGSSHVLLEATRVI